MKGLACLLLTTISLSALSQNQISIQSAKAKDTISRHIYGHFAEHLGRSIYDSFYVGEKNTTIPICAGRTGRRKDGM